MPVSSAVDGVEGVVGGVHKNTALQLDDRVVHAVLGSSLKDAMAGHVRLQICRAQHAAASFLAAGGRRVHIVDQLPLVQTWFPVVKTSAPRSKSSSAS